MANIQHVFEARAVDHTGNGTLTDGSVLYGVFTPDGERIASSENMDACRSLEIALNMALTEWLEEDETDRTVDA